MNTLIRPSAGRRAADAAGSLAGAVVYALLQSARVLLFAVLSICAPVVRVALAFFSVAGVLTAALFYSAGPPGLTISYAVLLTFSIGCAVALMLYETLLRALER